MEERDPPATSNDHDHNHHHNKYDTSLNNIDEEFDEYYNIKYDDNNNNNVTRKGHKENDDENPSSLEGNNKEEEGNYNQAPHATYIIQIPKDQIYRVPPPENAEIAERHRNPAQNTKNGRRRCLCWCLSIFFVVAFLVSIFVCVHHFTLKPKNPTFSIKHLVVKHPSTHHSKKNASPRFQVSLETTNPNNVNDIGYEQGRATLAYKGKQIGNGSFPGIQNEESGKSDSVDVILSGLSKGMPKELESHPHHKHNKEKPISLNLKLSIPLKMKTWLFDKKVNVKVGCDFEVNSITGEDIKVLSQKCDIPS